MKRIYYLAAMLLAGNVGFSQIPEDILKYGWAQPSGSARQLAIGGALTALGGDIGSTFVNPAGLGLYKTGEFVLSPGLQFLTSNGTFRGTQTLANNLSRFNLGASGFVIGGTNSNSKWTNQTISIAINQTANFNSTVHYRGINDYSSFAEPLADEFANSNLSIDNALNSPNISLLTKMGLYTYLIDTATIGGSKQVIARSEQAGILQQDQRVTTTGGINELAFGIATNMDDRVYLGITIGIPFVNYQRRTDWREEDANGKGNNEFSYSTYSETYTSKGAGVNVKLGLMFKPTNSLRVGLAIHTPSIFGLTDRISANMTTDIDTARGSVKVFSVNSNTVNDNIDPEYKYDLNTPLRLMGGLSYILNGVSDVTKQQGFISADVEYVGYGMMRYSSSDAVNYSQDFSNENSVIKDFYKSAVNFRVGGELKFNTLMTRLGFAYFGNPYKDPVLKATRMNISGGLGYRDKGYFLDLTYVHTLQTDVHFPYRVNYPRQNTFAELKDKNGGLTLTFGVKF